MDFFQAQESARSRTRTLVVLFVAAVAAIIGAIYVVVHITLGPGPGGPIDPVLLLLIAVLTTGLVTTGSTVRTLQLRQGGGRVAELLGGRRIRPNSTDEAERRLTNVVEEMAIASGTPMPAIYVLDREPGINAFAAGYTIDDAAVAVTRGTLDHLNRDELQGVIAHEFSHILNGDMRLNIRLMGLLFGILLLAVVGRGLLYSGRGGRVGGGRRGSGGGQVAIVGLALVLVGYIGVFFGRLIQAAVSRQREYLADAAAVQFTRNADGLAGALKKIGGAATGSRLDDHHAQEAGHLFFANGLGSSFASLLATHPPLDARIRRIEPRFDGRYPAVAAGRGAAGRGAVAAARASAASLAGVPMDVPPAAGAAAGRTGAGASGVTGSALLASVGAPKAEHVAYAGRLLDALPDDVRKAVHEPEQASALLFALLLEAAGAPLARQRDAIVSHGGAVLWSEVESLAAAVRGLGRQARLPLVDVLLPALRELSPDQQRAVRTTARALVDADEQTDVFERVLLYLLRRQLAGADEDAAPGATAGQRRSGDGGPDEAAVILSAVAWAGAADADAALEAFQAGAAHLRPRSGSLSLQPGSAADGDRIEAALDRSRTAPLAERRRLLEACTLTVAHDGRVGAEEAELLRAVAEAIELPLPPAL
jgi:Zn-dependent protease with chaperone function